MSAITLTPGAFILLALVCGFFSALVAGMVMKTIVASHVRESIHSTMLDTNTMLVRDVSCNVTIRAIEGGIATQREIVTSGAMVSAQFVAQWLDNNELVMAPKGCDYGMKVKAS